MTKVLLAVGIIVFFLAYPIPLMLMQSPDFQLVDTAGAQELTGTNILSLLGLYFSAMYLTFTNLGFLTIFVVILQIMGGLAVYFAIRG